MSESIKKPKKNPESFSPKKPEIVNMMDEAGKSVFEKTVTESGLINFEIVKCGPYRFVGKSMYVRAGQSDEFCEFALWGPGHKWVYPKIDGMKEYATDDIHDAALIHWDKYDDKNKLMGYTIGRFMKADAPVPENMDYIYIPEGYIAKGFVYGDIDSAIKMLRDEIERDGVYKEVGGIWSAEIFPYRLTDKNKFHGFYVPCELI